MDDRRQDSPRADAPDVLVLQPKPINTRVSHVTGPRGIQTAIAREWKLADARRCRLCPDRCRGSVSADGATAMCLMVAQAYVSLEDARLFSPARVIADVAPLDLRSVPDAVDGIQPLRAGPLGRSRGGNAG